MILKLINGEKVFCNLKQNDNVTQSIIIQKLLTLSEELYHEKVDCVSASYELDRILDQLIDM